MTEPSFEALHSAASDAFPGDMDLTPVVTTVLRLLIGWMGGMSAGSADAQGMLAALISEAEQR